MLHPAWLSVYLSVHLHVYLPLSESVFPPWLLSTSVQSIPALLLSTTQLDYYISPHSFSINYKITSAHIQRASSSFKLVIYTPDSIDRKSEYLCCACIMGLNIHITCKMRKETSGMTMMWCDEEQPGALLTSAGHDVNITKYEEVEKNTTTVK